MDYQNRIMETDVNAVAAGGAGGWVQGTPAGLAASGVAAMLFDLGPNWAAIKTLAIEFYVQGPSSGGSSGLCSFRDDATVSLNLPRRGCTPTGTLVSLVPAAGTPALTPVQVMGRYMFVQLTNADAANAMGAASKVTVFAQGS